MNNFKYKIAIDYILNYIYVNNKKGILKIPSERYISTVLNISRTAVKYAVDKLVDDKVLYKIQGKGTYLNSDIDFSKVSINKQNPDSLNLNVSSRGMKLESSVLSSRVLYDFRKLNSIFPEYITDFYELIRKRTVKNSYYCVEVAYFPFRIFPDANRYDFSKSSLYQYMEDKGHKPVHFNKSIKVTHNKAINNILKISEEIPLFLEEYQAFTHEGQLIEYTRAYSDSRFVEFDFTVN